MHIKQLYSFVILRVEALSEYYYHFVERDCTLSLTKRNLLNSSVNRNQTN